MTKTPEGYLICHDVAVARTGKYQYLGKELDDNLVSDRLYDVYRSEEEVFSDRAIASFNSKPVTNDHPPVLLDAENTQRYCMGVAENVRRSKNDPNLLLADLVIYNERLIKEIEEGKREVSCGYEYELVKGSDGTFQQTNIVGNHIAIVDKGRAGSRCKVMDSKNNNIYKKKEDKKRMGFFKHLNSDINETATKFLTSVGLKQFAQDADPEEIMGAIDALTAERKSSKDELPQEEVKPIQVAEPEKAEDEVDPAIASLQSQIDKLTELVSNVLQHHQEHHQENAIDNLIGELEGQDGCGEAEDEEAEEGESEVIEADDETALPEAEVSDPEDRPKNPIPGADSLVEILKVVKPLVASMEDNEAKKKACDSLQKIVNKAKKRKVSKDNSYAKILKSQKKAAADNMADQNSNSKMDFMEVGKNLAKMNPHYKG